jgi:hypothetical protein
MNRQERRKRDREIDKDKEFVKKLPASVTKRMNEIIDKITKDKAEQVTNLIYGSFISVLVTKGSTFDEIREVQTLMAEFMIDEKEKTKILEKENIDMTKLQIEIKEYMQGLLAQKKDRKEIIEETIYKFPKATKNMINRTFGEIDDEKVVEDAAAYILSENKEDKEMKKMSEKDVKKLAKQIVKNIVEDEENVVKEVDGFEVLEEVVIKEVKLKGRNGVYKAKTGLGVALESEGYKLAFSNIEELESFCNEFKKVFERI